MKSILTLGYFSLEVERFDLNTLPSGKRSLIAKHAVFQLPFTSGMKSSYTLANWICCPKLLRSPRTEGCGKTQKLSSPSPRIACLSNTKHYIHLIHTIKFLKDVCFVFNNVLFIILVLKLFFTGMITSRAWNENGSKPHKMCCKSFLCHYST